MAKSNRRKNPRKDKKLKEFEVQAALNKEVCNFVVLILNIFEKLKMGSLLKIREKIVF